MTYTIPTVFNRKFRLHSWEVDRKGRARPDMLFSFMLDSAWAHANNSEYSYDALREEGQLWVLSRFLAKIVKLPSWDEEITVETWGKGTDKLFGLRDFAIYSGSGQKIVSATSAWLVIDRKTSRIQRIDLEHSNFPLQADKHEIETKLGRIEEREAVRTGFEYVVRNTDIDVNNHVNSSRYLQWVLDSFPPSSQEERSLNSFEINFLAEAQTNDRVYTATTETEEGHYCEVTREGDGVNLCRAVVAYS
ncbi:MAG: thioesterase [Bacteroidetes bacterium]|nr:thioesterase [Bacteroidota bacterium]